MAGTHTKIKAGDGVGKFDFHFVPGKNLYTGRTPFEKEFGPANSLEEDLLNVASAIYASDLVVKRQPRELNIRKIEVTIEVVNFHAFERVRTLIETALFYVSRDNWTIHFKAKSGTAVSTFDWSSKDGAVLLFSGGIDSLSGAAKLLEKEENLVLVSHNSHGNTAVDDSQRNVHSALQNFFKQCIRHVQRKPPVKYIFSA